MNKKERAANIALRDSQIANAKADVMNEMRRKIAPRLGDAAMYLVRDEPNTKEILEIFKEILEIVNKKQS